MKVVILAGGFGTRIRDVSEDLPKPMIQIGPYPILWHIMKYFSTYGFNEFVICLGFKGNVIRNFFINYELYMKDVTIELGSNHRVLKVPHGELGWKISLVDTGLNAMTGARISKIKNYIKEDNFFITYGDGVGDINLKELLNFHKSHKKVLTVTGVRPPGRFGELRHKNNVVTDFNEKPQTSSGRISGGFFVANKKIFNYISNDEELIFEKEPMNKLVNENNLMLFKHDGFWQPMDTGREFKILNSLYEENKAPWVIW